MVKIQFSVKNAFIQKYTLFLTAVCFVMTFMNMMNRIHYIGASYAIGAILMGITNHIHNSLSITGIGCILDILHLIFRSSNSSWASVRYFQFIMHFLAIVYELMYMTMLHCYWQYTEATQNQPQTSWLENQTILPIKLGQFKAAAVNPSIAMSPPIEMTEPTMDPTTHEPNTAASNSILETPEPSAETESSTATEKGVAVPKPTLSSTEPNVGVVNSIPELLQPIETTDPDENTTDPDENTTELSEALTDPITPIQEPNTAAIDSVVETQESIIAMESSLVSEPDENGAEHNVILTENISTETPQKYSVSTPEPKEEKE